MRPIVLSAALCCLALAGFAQPPAQAPRPSPAAVEPPALDADTPSNLPGLENVVAYAPGLYSGAAPDGLTAFDTLRALGVKTILSVDGASPELATAKSRGIRYIHLPIGYNGMDRQRTLQIAKAIDQARARGPVYIHCHHGKHRSACAAGAAAVTLGLLTNEQATLKLKVSGTAPDYTGLFTCVAVAYAATKAELDAVPDDFPEIWKTSGIVNTMVEIDDVCDHLKAVERAGWTVPKDQPDLVPVAEAAHLADLFRVLGNDPQAKSKPAEFRDRLATASERASEIEGQLAKPAADPALELGAKLKSLTRSCKECHAKYRD